MPLDIQFFMNLSEAERKFVREDLFNTFQKAQTDLNIVDGKVRFAMEDENCKPSELGPLLSYRSERQQEMSQLKKDLDTIRRCNEGQVVDRDLSNVPGMGSGVINIRADDSRNRPVPKAKTYSDLVKEEKDKKVSLDDALAKIEAFKKMIESMKEEEVKKYTTTQIS